MTTYFVNDCPATSLEVRIAKAREELDKAYDYILDLAVVAADRKGGEEVVTKIDRTIANAREAKDCLAAIARYAEQLKYLGY